MSEFDTWVEAKIRDHRHAVDRPPEALQDLLTACIALKKRAGTMFGLAYPADGLDNAAALYEAACRALEGWLAALEDDAVVKQLATLIVQKQLDIDGAAERLPSPEPPWPAEVDLEQSEGRADSVGRIASLVRALREGGANVSVARASAPPAEAEVRDAVVGELSPALLTLLTTWPGRVELEWWHEEADAGGGWFYALAEVAELQQRCAERIEDDHPYYDCWRGARALASVDEGNGVLALDPAGRVIYLSDDGDDESNGLVLGQDAAAFLRTWTSLGCVLDHDVLAHIRAGGSLEDLAATRWLR